MNKSALQPLRLTLVLILSLTAPPAWAVADIDQVRQLIETKQCPNCDLTKANFRKLNLRGANLAGANLAGADLRKTDLRDANLSGASLIGAKLREAKLRRANFYRADLRRTDLRTADLRKADLRLADLQSADLTHADMEDALFGRTNLLNARGVDEHLKKKQVWRPEIPEEEEYRVKQPGFFARTWYFLTDWW